jgi:hypothetical protein
LDDLHKATITLDLGVVGLSEVDNLYHHFPRNHQILRLEIHMHDTVALQIAQSLHQHMQYIDLTLQGESLPFYLQVRCQIMIVIEVVHKQVVGEPTALISHDVVTGQEASHAALDVLHDTSFMGHPTDPTTWMVPFHDHRPSLRSEAL